MTKRKQTFLNLPENIHKMIRLAAAKAAVTMSEYITELVVADCKRNGIANLVDRADEEVRHDR